jgi:hypothetical protein
VGRGKDVNLVRKLKIRHNVLNYNCSWNSTQDFSPPKRWYYCSAWTRGISYFKKLRY